MQAEDQDMEFYGGDPPVNPARDLVAVIPSSIGDTDELLRQYAVQLHLPGYFGFNWNALSDCLRDLSWVTERRVVIVHQGLPRLEEGDLKVYLDVLGECVRSWTRNENHQVVIAFPKDCKDAVAPFLGA